MKTVVELTREVVAEKFEKIGAGKAGAMSIGERDFTVLQVPYQKTFKSQEGKTRKISYNDGKHVKGVWKNLCSYVYETISNRAFPEVKDDGEAGKLPRSRERERRCAARLPR